MNFRALAITFSVFTAFDALAFNVENFNCPRNEYSQFSKMSGLIEQAAVAQNDNRGALTKRGPELGLTEHDIKHIRASTGYINCPGTPSPEEVQANKGLAHPKANKNSATGSATLIEADDQIVTNAHIFFDFSSGKPVPRDPLSECVFQNQSERPQRRYLRLKNGQAGIDQAIAMGLLKLGDLSDLSNRSSDRAVVKLKPSTDKRAEKLLPFSIDSKPIALHGCSEADMESDLIKTAGEHKRCQSVVVVSALQLRMPIVVSPYEPIVQECHIRLSYPASGDNGQTVYSDCSATRGASGSITFLVDDTGQLRRDEHGELIPMAIVESGSLETTDHRPFSTEGASGNFEESLVLDGGARLDIFLLATRRVQDAGNP